MDDKNIATFPEASDSSRERKCKKSPKDARWKRNPKRLSGYQFFLRVCLDELKGRFPDHSIVLSEVSKLCAENWQNLSDAQKKCFQDEADSLNACDCGGKNCAKKGKHSFGPKRPLSAFILFCKENRQYVKLANPGLTMGQISTVLSIMWRQTDKEAKLKYQQMSGVERERYREEVKANASKAAALSAIKIEPQMVEFDLDQIKTEVEVPDDEELHEYLDMEF